MQTIRHAVNAATPAGCGGRHRVQHTKLQLFPGLGQLRNQLRPARAGAEIVTDKAVPEGHKGLHGFLYGDGGAEKHDSDSTYAVRQGEDDGSVILPVSDYLDGREGEQPVGVFSVYDSRKNVQYVGYSRNIVVSVRGARERVGEEKCAYTRTMVFANKAMQTKATLERQVQNWLEECGTIPPGNGVEQEIWQGSKAMTPAEQAIYEEKALKMKKAMGVNLHDPIPGETPDAAQRRLNLIKAVKGDNWSAVIDEQTKATLPAAAAAEAPPAPAAEPAAVVTPFANARVHREIGNANLELEPMTVEAVDKALDEVRPYLIADGGDVEVADVQNGVVLLRLQGACGTCPSSTATMKMGIERALQAKFGSQLVEVMQIDKIDTTATVASVNSHLDQLRQAIYNLGGKADVLRVEDGQCEIRYTGPAPLGMGVKAAVKDKFPDIKEVIFVS